MLSLLVLSVLGAGAVYGLTFSLQRFEVQLTRGMRIHLSMLGGLILLVIALGSYLGVFDLVTSPGGIVTGATFTDINARLPARYALIALGAFAGLVTIVNSLLSSSWRAPAFAVSLWVIAGILGGFIYPSFVQSFQVDPNELEKEQLYIERNIEGTRHAWGLDEIVETEFPAEPAVTEEELAANQATLDNVRLLDPRPMRDTFNQIQSIRPLYQFDDVDVDRYVIDGNLQQVMLAPRELDLRRATQTSGSSGWTQQRLQFTHGYGAVVARVNEITTEGLPVLITRDIPPVGEEIPISEDGARIYFGELTDHYVIVNAKEDEFDYPEGDTTKGTRYEPDRGIELSNILQRLSLAWQLGDRNLLISGQLSSDSRLLMHRSLDDRIRKVAPFLELDSDAYLVVIDGELLWIQDAYTTSRELPVLAAPGVHQLRAQQRQGRRRRADRRHDLLPDRPRRPDRRDLGRRSSRTCSRPPARCRNRSARTCATRRTCSGCRRSSTCVTTSGIREPSSSARTCGRCRRRSSASRSSHSSRTT